MKAKFIAVADKFEMIFENKKVVKSALGETKKMFLKRVKEDAALDVGELEISELTSAAFAETPLDKLKLAAGKAQGLTKVLLQEAISLKEGASKEEAKAAKDAEKALKAEAAAKVKAEKIAEKEAKAKARAEAVVNKPSLEEVLEAAKVAKENVGHTVKFNAHGTIIKTDGVVNGVWVDKRVPMALYRIFDADGKMFNKVISAPDLEFGELAPNPKAEEKAAKLAEKEAAAAAKLIAKEEEAAAKLAEKEAAAKAKEEAATAKAAEKLEAAKLKAEKLAADAEAKAAKAASDLVAKQEAAAKLAEMKAAKIAEDAAKA